MKLNINVKPIIFSATTKEQIVEKIEQYHMVSVGSTGNYLAPYPHLNRNTIRVYNLEKHRKVVERKVKKGKTSSEIVSRGHWVGYVYDIPKEFFKIGKLKVKQNYRNFIITKA